MIGWPDEFLIDSQIFLTAPSTLSRLAQLGGLRVVLDGRVAGPAPPPIDS
jgi:hypothetical protein